MTVKELIEELKKMPQSSTVVAWHRSTKPQISDIEYVDITTESGSSGEPTKTVILNLINRPASQDSTKG